MFDGKTIFIIGGTGTITYTLNKLSGSDSQKKK